MGAILSSEASSINEESTSLSADRELTGTLGQEVPLAPPDKQPPDLEVPELVKRKVGYVIAGLSKLSLEQILPAFSECIWSEPVALDSRHPEKVKKVAEFYHIDPRNIYDYSNYDRLAENRRVDAIYIVLPNNMHAESTIRGLRAGKHVRCEKPMGVNVSECKRLIKMGHLANCVLNNKQVRTPGKMGLADMRIINALTDSLNGGGAAVAIR